MDNERIPWAGEGSRSERVTVAKRSPKEGREGVRDKDICREGRRVRGSRMGTGIGTHVNGIW